MHRIAVDVNGDVVDQADAYAASSGTAAAGDDFISTSGVLSWADGDAADKTFSIA